MKGRDLEATLSPTFQFMQVPRRATNPEHNPLSVEGAVYMHSTNGLTAWNGSSWAAVDTSSSGTLDAVYNNSGNAVTVDGSDMVFNLAAVTTQFTIANTYGGTQAVGLEIDSAAANRTITDALKFSTSGASAVITTAVNASAADITTALAIGGNAITGTNFAVSAAGAVTCQDVTGSDFACGNLTVNTDLTVENDTTVKGVLGVVGAVSFSDALTVRGKLTCTDIDCSDIVCNNFTAASATYNGMTINGDLDVTVVDTTGDGAYINGSAITTGNILRLEADAATLNGGKIFNCTLDTVSKFSVAEDGATVIAGTALGTAALTVTAGDATITSGTLAVSHGEMSVARTGARNANLFTLTKHSGETNGIDGIEINSGTNAASGALMDLNVTGAITVPTIDVRVSAAATSDILNFAISDTVSGDVIGISHGAISTGKTIAVAYTAAATGDAIELDMTTAVGAVALNMIGAGTRTADLVEITDVPKRATFDIDTTIGSDSGAVFDIDESGTSAGNIIDITFAAAHTGDALAVSMGSAVSAQAVAIDAAGHIGAANLGLMHIATSGSGNRAQYSNLLRVVEAGNGTAAGATNGLCAYFSDSSAEVATSYAVHIAAKNNEALYVSAGKSTFAEQVTFSSDIVLADGKYVKCGTSYSDMMIGSNGTTDFIVNKFNLIIGSDTSHYTMISNDGVVTFKGNARRSKKIWFAAGEFDVHTGSAAMTNVSTGPGRGWAFDASADEAIATQFLVPPDFDATVTPTLTIFYTANATSGKCVWEITTNPLIEDEAAGAAGSADQTTDTLITTAWDLSKTGAVSLSGTWAANDMAILKVLRNADDGSDTCTTDVIFLGAELAYTANAL